VSVIVKEVSHTLVGVQGTVVRNQPKLFICVWIALVTHFTYESSVRLGYVATANDAIVEELLKYAISLFVPLSVAAFAFNCVWIAEVTPFT